MPGVENYHKHPGQKLEDVLEACLWVKVGRGLWEKGQSRLYVDNVGIFLYRFLGGAWVRTHGLAHNRIFPHARVIVFKDLSTLNLVSAELLEHKSQSRED